MARSSGLESDGAAMRNARIAAGLTITDVAEAAGVGTAYVSRLERGLQRNPSPPVLKRLADALGVPLVEIAVKDAVER